MTYLQVCIVLSQALPPADRMTDAMAVATSIHQPASCPVAQCTMLAWGELKCKAELALPDLIVWHRLPGSAEMTAGTIV